MVLILYTRLKNSKKSDFHKCTKYTIIFVEIRSIIIKFTKL